MGDLSQEPQRKRLKTLMELARNSVTASDADITLAELSNTFRAAVSELLDRGDWSAVRQSDQPHLIEPFPIEPFPNLPTPMPTPTVAHAKSHQMVAQLYSDVDESQDGRLNKKEFQRLLTLMFQV